MADDSKFHTDLPEGDNNEEKLKNTLPSNNERSKIRSFVENYNEISLENLAKNFPLMTSQNAFSNFYTRFTGVLQRNLAELEEMKETSSKKDHLRTILDAGYNLLDEIETICDDFIRNNKYSSEEVDHFRKLHLYRENYSATEVSIKVAFEMPQESDTRRAIEFTIDLYKELRAAGYTHEDLSK